MYELQLWNKNLSRVNFRVFTEPHGPSKVVFVDASDHACGAFLESGKHVAHGMFNSWEMAQSSTYREL